LRENLRWIEFVEDKARTKSNPPPLKLGTMTYPISTLVIMAEATDTVTRLER